MPCRFVDFTYSFYIAAYFALSRANSDTYVWGIDNKWLSDKEKEKLKEINKPDTRKGNVKDNTLRKEANFYQLFFEKPINFIAAVNSERHNIRLRFQKGLLVGPSNIEETFEENLKGMSFDIEELRKNVVRIKIENKTRGDAIRHLSQMNISSGTLFPELSEFVSGLRDYIYLRRTYDQWDLDNVFKCAKKT